MGLDLGDLAIDFASLAEIDENFAQVYKARNGRLDFQDPQTVQQLTKSILKSKFKIEIELPNDRLCPPVPIRYEYIRWLQKLIDTTSSSYSDVYDTQRDVIGLDIGIGASCIYPLIGNALRPNWKFIGTEIDSENFQWATQNVHSNNLGQAIKLVRTKPTDPLLSYVASNMESVTFVMCNPPFFTSIEEMLATHTTKMNAPSAVCTGAEFEMVTEGGDLGFAVRILEESEKLREKIQWYSCMLGKLSSVYSFVKILKERGLTNWAVTTLQPGKVTRRWVMAWSFQDMRPSNDVARHSTTAKEILPFPTEYVITLPRVCKEKVESKINEKMDGLDVYWNWTSSSSTGICFAHSNVWSRSARRARAPRNDDIIERMSGLPSTAFQIDDAKLGVRIGLEGQSDVDLPNKVNVRWLKGHESVLFESFCGMLKRALDL